MYHYPVVLPMVSNREDFLLTVAINDDFSGDPIDLDGCNLATPGQSFTGSAWTVSNGLQSSPSTTTLVIPTFPIVSAAQAGLSLVVNTGLGFVQGQPVTISDATGLNTMSGYILSYVPASGALIVQIGMTFLLEIRRGSPSVGQGSLGYNTWPDIGSIANGGPILSARLGTGVAILDIGLVGIVIPAGTFQQLGGGTYAVGMILSDSVSTRQLFAGTLPVVQGAVSRSAFAAASPL